MENINNLNNIEIGTGSKPISITEYRKINQRSKSINKKQTVKQIKNRTGTSSLRKYSGTTDNGYQQFEKPTARSEKKTKIITKTASQEAEAAKGHSKGEREIST